MPNNILLQWCRFCRFISLPGNWVRWSTIVLDTTHTHRTKHNSNHTRTHANQIQTEGGIKRLRSQYFIVFAEEFFGAVLCVQAYYVVMCSVPSTRKRKQNATAFRMGGAFNILRNSLRKHLLCIFPNKLQNRSILFRIVVHHFSFSSSPFSHFFGWCFA